MQEKTVNQKGWLFVLPVLVLVAFSAVIPLMTVGTMPCRTRSRASSSRSTTS